MMCLIDGDVTPQEFCFFPVVVSKVDSTAEINYELFSDPVFQTTYFQTQHTVGFSVYIYKA